MPISKAEFKDALRCFASGVTVVTTQDADGQYHGITVSAFCSVSLEPPLILICIEKDAGSHDAIAENGNFVVNVLGQNQQNISNHFAAHIPDKFEGVEFQLNERGIPLLNNVLVNLECNLKYSYEGGDHTIFVGEIERSTVSEGDPLLYFDGNYRKLD